MQIQGVCEVCALRALVIIYILNLPCLSLRVAKEMVHEDGGGGAEEFYMFSISSSGTIL